MANNYENYRRHAVAHLKKNGQAYDEEDIRGEYNSGLPDEENISNFDKNHPIITTRENVDTTRHETPREEKQWERRAEESRQEQVRQEKQEMVKEHIEKYGIKQEPYLKSATTPIEEELPAPSGPPSKNKSGLIQSVVSAFIPSEEVRANREKEAQYKEMQKQKTLSEKLKTSQIKAQTRTLEKDNAYYKKQEMKESGYGRLAAMGEGLAKAGRSFASGQGGVYDTGIRRGARDNFDSGSTVRGLLTQGSKPSEVSSRFGLGSTALTRTAYGRGYNQQQFQGRGRYITIYDKGQQKRVRVPADAPLHAYDYSQSIPPSEYQTQTGYPPQMVRSPLESLMFQQPQQRQMMPNMQFGSSSPMMQRSEPFPLTRMILQPQSQRMQQSKPNPLFQFGTPNVTGRKQMVQTNQSAIARLTAQDTNPRVKAGNAPYMKFMGDITHPKKKR